MARPRPILHGPPLIVPREGGSKVRNRADRKPAWALHFLRPQFSTGGQTRDARPRHRGALGAVSAPACISRRGAFPDAPGFGEGTWLTARTAYGPGPAIAPLNVRGRRLEYQSWLGRVQSRM